MKCLLYVHSGPDTFTLEGPYDLYNLALLAGQSFGYANFYIDTGSRVPSRDTQLGLCPDTYIKQKITRNRSKKQKLIQED